ncbi:hypothetical protein TcCL_NonESM11887 [Trypanosoma cruzi]|uniref:Uncharacterized protein n=1 Tax=Trypanosoma cruzi (strain CL Brener) TaxID=353153 RepID=Q4E1F1_TRYCC|nr:uncharacterized protein Tc00.1047053508139.120 [Trypanosoma cruzi]EAN98598.1 hypothetical protein Tc00.1047053508139.120 [Trypanosoma cruzi]RNC38826.1 hypothetical protein TcCL_NonESM11887 [Trypanosoma cruzi]|eukprot:XP_820449.1 hypothetical protein Tc00.1047053508139.120 [Trypanosoma cruzi strain CL Brener]
MSEDQREGVAAGGKHAAPQLPAPRAPTTPPPETAEAAAGKLPKKSQNLRGESAAELSKPAAPAKEAGQVTHNAPRAQESLPPKAPGQPQNKKRRSDILAQEEALAGWSPCTAQQPDVLASRLHTQ